MRRQPYDQQHTQAAAVKAGVCLLLLAGLPGCANTVPVAKFNETQARLQRSQEEVNRVQAALSEQQEANRTLQAEAANLRQIQAPLEDLIVPVKIELERLSGGYPEQGRFGDIGIVLYVQPIDRDGDTVKAAGSIDVKLFDLQNPPDSSLIAEYHFDAQKTRSLWYGRMWTQHFTVHCPWPQGHPPAHTLVTAQVVFTDLLTGTPLRAQNAYTLRLPPSGTSPAQ